MGELRILRFEDAPDAVGGFEDALLLFCAESIDSHYL